MNMPNMNTMMKKPHEKHILITSILLSLLCGLLPAEPVRAATLEFVEAHFDDAGLDRVYATAVSPDGTAVITGSLWDNTLVAFRRDATTGRLLWMTSSQKDGIGGVDGLNAVSAAAFSPDGKHVYAVGADDDAVVVFSISSGASTLTFVEVKRHQNLDGPHAVAVSPDGAHVYVAALLDNALVVFQRDAAAGHLTFMQGLEDGVGGVNGLAGVSSVAVSADNAHVYVAGSSDDAVAVFARHPMTGLLTFVEIQQDGVNGVDGLDAIAKVAVSPDGAQVYATGNGDDHSVAVFRRDAVTGRLTFVTALKDGQHGVYGLTGAWGLDVSPDNAAVYATGHEADAVVVFRTIDEPDVSSYLLWTK